MKTLAYLLAAGALALFTAMPVLAQSLPSSKATIANGSLTALGAYAAGITDGRPTQDTGYLTIMQNYIKMADQKDLYFVVALQCGLVTDTTVRSGGGTRDSSSAQGSITVRVKATNLNTGEVRYAEPSEAGTSDDGGPRGVTYCFRLQQLEARFAGLNCSVDLNPESPTYGMVTCTDPEELRLLLETLNANSFNFYLAEAVSGVHQIEVQARAEASVALGGGGLGEAGADAFVGLGSMVAESVRLIKSDEVPSIVELK
jgi:hypothetical protein